MSPIHTSPLYPVLPHPQLNVSWPWVKPKEAAPSHHTFPPAIPVALPYKIVFSTVALHSYIVYLLPPYLSLPRSSTPPPGLSSLLDRLLPPPPQYLFLPRSSPPPPSLAAEHPLAMDQTQRGCPITSYILTGHPRRSPLKDRLLNGLSPFLDLSLIHI